MGRRGAGRRHRQRPLHVPGRPHRRPRQPHDRADRVGRRRPEVALRGMGRTVSPRAFGHNGAGGQVAWADPVSGLSFAFLTSGLDRHPLAHRPARRGTVEPRRGPDRPQRARFSPRSAHERGNTDGTPLGDGRVLPLHRDPHGAHARDRGHRHRRGRHGRRLPVRAPGRAHRAAPAPAPALPPAPGRGPAVLRPPGVDRGPGLRHQQPHAPGHLARARAGRRSWPSSSATSCPGRSTGSARCGRCGWPRAARRARSR